MALLAQAGAGLVYDSVPENEQQECINKAKALVRAAEAVRGFGGRVIFYGEAKDLPIEVDGSLIVYAWDDTQSADREAI